MKKFKFKIIPQILFVIIYLFTPPAKSLDKFDKADGVYNYFSGILLLNDKQYEDSLRYLKKLNGLEGSNLTIWKTGRHRGVVSSGWVPRVEYYPCFTVTLTSVRLSNSPSYSKYQEFLHDKTIGFCEKGWRHGVSRPRPYFESSKLLVKIVLSTTSILKPEHTGE